MRWSATLLDRAAGALLGAACGDALGAGYEFAPVTEDLVPDMVGGGLGDFEPGEWTDDTAQLAAIAAVAAAGGDLRSAEALTEVARGFARWLPTAKDVGIQTRRVLLLAGERPTAAEMRAAARTVHEETGRSAGNGSLMRTAPVALAHLDDPEGLVASALAVSALTHEDPMAGEACALWCLLIRHAVLTGDLPAYDDVAPWVPRVEHWRGVLADAEARPPADFAENAWVVGALQAAWSALTHTSDEDPSLTPTLTTAIRIGHDTDTVAAIAGSLAGARLGARAVPAPWRRMLHGWPDWHAGHLVAAAADIATGPRPGLDAEEARQVGTAVLEAVGVLHRRGFQQVRVLPGMAPSGAWRLRLWTEGGHPLAYSTASGRVVGSIWVDPEPDSDELADLLLASLALEEPTADAGYAAWYAGLLAAVVGERGLPVAPADHPVDHPVDHAAGLPAGWAILGSRVRVPEPPERRGPSDG